MKWSVNGNPVAVSGRKCVADSISCHGDALEIVGGCESPIMKSDKLTRSLTVGYLCDTNGGI